MDTILVTGGAGFIGANFIRHVLREATYRVANLDKLTYAANLASLPKPSEYDPGMYSFIHGDIADQSLLDSLLAKIRPALILNLAAESHVDRSIDSPAAFVETNVVGSFRMLEASLRYWEQLDKTDGDRFRFIQVSTDEVYGSADEQPFTEASPYRPNSPYSASKAAADHFALAFHRTYGLPVIVTHSSNNFGPYQHPEKLIPRMILAACAGRPMPVYGDGLHRRDWIYVEDHCHGLIAAMHRGIPGDHYLFGSESDLTNLEIVQRICDLVDRFRPDPSGESACRLITHVEDRPGHDRRYAVDTRLTREKLGWRPSFKLEESLERTVRWYLENDDWLASTDDDRRRLGLRGDEKAETGAIGSGRPSQAFPQGEVE